MGKKEISVQISFNRVHSPHALETFLNVYILTYNEPSVSIFEEA